MVADDHGGSGWSVLGDVAPQLSSHARLWRTFSARDANDVMASATVGYLVSRLALLLISSDRLLVKASISPSLLDAPKRDDSCLGCGFVGFSVSPSTPDEPAIVSSRMILRSNKTTGAT